VRSHHEIRDEITATLRVEMRAMAGDLRGEMKAMAGDLRGEMKAMGDALSARIRDQHDEMYSLHALTNARFDKVDAAMAEGLAETHRHMLMLHEEVLSRVALLSEGRRG